MTVSNRLGITELASTQTERSATVNEAIAKLEAGAMFFPAVQVLVNAPPGSPVEGDVYVVGTAGSGAWSGHNENVTLYYNASWLFFTPIEGMFAWDQTSNSLKYYNGSDWVSYSAGAGSTPYDLPLSFSGTPTAGQLMGKLVMVRDVDLGANFLDSAGHVGTNPAATFAIDVQDNGSTIGTISVSTGGTFTFTTSGGTAKTVVAGNRLEFYAPANSPAEATVADIAATLKGTTG